eukprot:Skav219536  [mRNA]  locus=scaffold30:812033:821367:- [translate_table: standard]
MLAMTSFRGEVLAIRAPGACLGDMAEPWPEIRAAELKETRLLGRHSYGCSPGITRHHQEIMQIFIKTLTGRKTNFNFELDRGGAELSDQDNTVRHVKEALQEKEGIQVEQIRLIYSGKQMSDECTLNDYNVKPGSTVHMVLQLRGGC